LLLNRLTLHEIGIKHHTDKAVHHQYTILYDYWFSKLRDRRIRMLEIGILLGGSLRMWHEYFWQAEKIYGADLIMPEERNVSPLILGSNVELLRLDQTNRKQLNNLPDNLDLIIDDGGHTMEQQQVSFAELFSHLKSGGTYVIEDLHTSCPDYAETHGCNPSNNTLNLLLDLKRGKFNKKSEYFISKVEWNWLYSEIEKIEIVFIKQNSITCRIKRNHQPLF
jgi:hypothetical protein